MNIKKKAVGLLFISITLMGFDFKGCGGINEIMEKILKQKTPKREKHKIDLAEIIKSERISSIFIRKNEAPLENQIKDRLKELCPNLDISQIRIYERDFRDNTVIIYAGQESSYSGFVTIRYTLSNLSDKSHLIDLSKIIKIKEIDCINDNQTSIKHQAADQLKKLYPELDMSQIDVQSYVVMPGSMDEGRTGVMVSPKIVPKIVMFDKGDYATIESCYTGEVDLWCLYTSANDEDAKKAIDLSKEVKKLKKTAPPNETICCTSAKEEIIKRVLEKYQFLECIINCSCNPLHKKKIAIEIAEEILKLGLSPNKVQYLTGLSNKELFMPMYKTRKSLNAIMGMTHLSEREIAMEMRAVGVSAYRIRSFTGLSKKAIDLEIIAEILKTGTCPDKIVYFTGISKEEMAMPMFKAGKSLDDIIDFTGLSKKGIIKAIFESGELLYKIMRTTGLALSRQEVIEEIFQSDDIDKITRFTGLSRQETAEEMCKIGHPLDKVMDLTRLSEKEMAVAMFKAGKSLDDITNFTGLYEKAIIIEILKTGTFLNDVRDFNGLSKEEIVQYCLENRKIKKDENCSICLDLLVSESLSFLCSCGHILHEECSQYLEKQAEIQKIKSQCPICRHELVIRINIKHDEIDSILGKYFE